MPAGQATVDMVDSRKRTRRESKPYRLNSKQRCSRFKAESGARLKGYEIIRKFKDVGWCVGRVLTQATDASIKDAKRVANFRVFYECDGELLNQSLYSNTYARGASAAVGTWMVIACSSRMHGCSDAPRARATCPDASWRALNNGAP